MPGCAAAPQVAHNTTLLIIVRILEGIGEGVTFPAMHDAAGRSYPGGGRDVLAPIHSQLFLFLFLSFVFPVGPETDAPLSACLHRLSCLASRDAHNKSLTRARGRSTGPVDGRRVHICTHNYVPTGQSGQTRPQADFFIAAASTLAALWRTSRWPVV
eukprot:SAG22_NODE_122_length_18920_cov_23.494076_23_plen_157_part_00